MTQYSITAPASLNTSVKLPASKSISNRALIICALAGVKEEKLPDNLSDCDDTEVIVEAMRSMPDVIDIKAAGTAMRFMTAFLAATDNGEHVLTGTERMKQRPINVLVKALTAWRRHNLRWGRGLSATSHKRQETQWRLARD